MSRKRLATLIVGYLCAVVAAGLVLALPLIAWMLSPMGAITWETIGDALGALAVYCSLVCVFAVVPAVLAIVMAERLAITSPLGHALGGATTGLAGLAIMVAVSAPTGGSLPGMVRDSLIGHAIGFFVALALVAGVCAGLAFWLVAVRWLGPRRAPPPDAAKKA